MVIRRRRVAFLGLLTICCTLWLLRDRGTVTLESVRRRGRRPSTFATRTRNGLLEYDRPDPQLRLRHPVTGLIETAAARWEARLARQSTTFEAACAEYRRRYGRPPPQQFDIWWQCVDELDTGANCARFARARKVKLIDVRPAAPSGLIVSGVRSDVLQH